MAAALSPEAHALIMRRVAARTVADARAAWRKARKSPTEKHVRHAYRTCLLAARMLRKTAATDGVPKSESVEMLLEAIRLDPEIGRLQEQLVRIVEGVEIPPDR